MKKYNSIKESQGLVDKDGIQWNDLSDLITEYVYDVKHGLNADPFYDEDNEQVVKGNIEGYYQYKNSKKMPSYIIPDWIGSFTINIIKEKGNKGVFIKKTAYLNELQKLNFTIEIGSAIEDPDTFCNTLVHEFQHAYSFWIQLLKGFYMHTNRTANLYHHATKGFDNERYSGSFVPMAMQKFPDLIEINNEVFENAEYLERILLTGFYYSDIDEIRSFIQEFANDIMHKIKKNIDDIKDDIRQALAFKGDFNNLTKEEQFYANILNNISINCYSSAYYKTYKSYYNFYKKLENSNIDEDIAAKAINGAKKAIKLSLRKNMAKDLIKFDGDANNILKQIAKKQIPIYEKALKKMQKIFVKLIMEIPIK